VEAYSVVSDEIDWGTGRETCAAYFNPGEVFGAGVFEGVGEQVHEHLFQQQGVSLAGREVAHVDFDLPALAFGAKLLPRLLDEMGGSAPFAPKRVAAGPGLR